MPKAFLDFLGHGKAFVFLFISIAISDFYLIEIVISHPYIIRPGGELMDMHLLIVYSYSGVYTLVIVGRVVESKFISAELRPTVDEDTEDDISIFKP